MRASARARFVPLVALLWLACGDEDVEASRVDGSTATDASLAAPVALDAGRTAALDASLAGMPDASAPMPAFRPECQSRRNDEEVARSVCECREPDAGHPPLHFSDDAGLHVVAPEPWLVSLDCMCAQGQCPHIERALRDVLTVHCGCGAISIEARFGLGTKTWTYALDTLELIGSEVLNDTSYGPCQEVGYSGGRVDLSTCPDYRECAVPSAVVPCPQ